MIKFQRRKRQLDIFWLLMGSVAEIMGLALFVPFADSLLWHEERSWIFLVPAVLAIALGLSFSWLGRDHKRQINVWEGALFMVLVWPLLSILGMMPYVLSGILVNPVDAFFEKVTVNAPDPKIRANRLRLLADIRAATRAIADFDRIEG